MTLDPRYVNSYLGIFRRFKDEEDYLRRVRYGGRSWKARGVDELALQMTQSGNKHVYAYRFDWDEQPSLLGFDLSRALGAAHAMEIPFVFDDFEGGLGLSYIYPHDENQADLTASITSYWTEFAYNGSPGTGRDGKQPAWTAWGCGRQHVDHSRLA